MGPSGNFRCLLALAATTVLAAGCGGEETATVTTATTATETETETVTRTETETVTASPGSGDGEGQTRSCGDVAFQPQSDAGAFDIEATGASCSAARAVARAAEGEGRSYSARGFSCSGTPGGGELPSTEFTCTGEDAVVTFSAS